MGDRKYRQRGYMEDDRDRERGPKAPAPRDREPRGRPPVEPRKINMPGYQEVVRCARCGQIVGAAIGFDTKCPRCGSDLHTCAQCVHFDTSARFECQQPVPARVAPKDQKNGCTFFEPRVTVERVTTTPAVSNARKAFDDLFKL
jgi:phage FluMu protein Com